jgi:dihydrofolate reductase
MGKVIVDLSMSLDGFSAGPNVGVENPLGENGERLHDWMADDPAIQDYDYFKGIGAFLMGRRTFDLGLEPWGDNPPFHAPCFVVTHTPHEVIQREGGTSYTFVTEGIERALEKAQAAAGDRDIIVMGGANVAQQYVKAGLVDELVIHIAPVFLGAGTRLFDHLEAGLREMELEKVDGGPGVAHLRLRAQGVKR